MISGWKGLGKTMSDLRVRPGDPEKKIRIYVNGRECPAFLGETVLAALTAAGHNSLRKSRQVQEPRGALCGMGVCYECLVSVNGVPGRRACLTEVQDLMEIKLDES
jgi:sarcosine oxidase subunit alpha